MTRKEKTYCNDSHYQNIYIVHAYMYKLKFPSGSSTSISMCVECVLEHTQSVIREGQHSRACSGVNSSTTSTHSTVQHMQQALTSALIVCAFRKAKGMYSTCAHPLMDIANPILIIVATKYMYVIKISQVVHTCM